jgi:hypothetical protein
LSSKSDLGTYVNYAFDQIRHIIDSFGPRDPGSPGEKKAQEYIAGQLANWTDETKIEEFKVHPKAFMGFMPVSGLLLLASVGAYWLAPGAALALSALALLIALLQFLFYRQFLDPFFPHRISRNVIGIRKPAGETRRRIIISGHVDAAYEWRYFFKGGHFLLKAVIAGALLGAFGKVIIDLIYCISAGLAAGSPEGVWRILGLVQLIFLPFFIAMIFFSDFRTVSPGANDNLTGTWAALSVMKYLHDTEARFQNTEVRCLITGSEEAGLRGAKAYARRHREELKSVETIFVGLETFRDLEHLSVYNRDMSGTVRHHDGVCSLLQRAGKRCGMDLPLASIFLGSSDAAAFSQAGIPSGALAAMDPAPATYYHTRLDHWNNMDQECFEISLRIVLEAIRLYDAEGLG